MEKVFVYGTLLSTACNPASHYVGATVIDKGWIIGRLYDLGWYPGYRPEANIDAAIAPRVFGEVIEVSENDLARLDDYEGYPALYDRQKVWVHTETDLVEAWVYIYNHVDYCTNDRCIPSGSWLEHEECA